MRFVWRDGWRHYYFEAHNPGDFLLHALDALAGFRRAWPRCQPSLFITDGFNLPCLVPGDDVPRDVAAAGEWIDEHAAAIYQAALDRFGPEPALEDLPF